MRGHRNPYSDHSQYQVQARTHNIQVQVGKREQRGGSTRHNSGKITNIHINQALKRQSQVTNIDAGKSESNTRMSSQNQIKGRDGRIGDVLEQQLKEMLRRRLEEEISRVDVSCSIGNPHEQSDVVLPNMKCERLSIADPANEYRPVSAMDRRPKRQHLIQFALPENAAMRPKTKGLKSMNQQASAQTIQRHFGRDFSEAELRDVANSTLSDLRQSWNLKHVQYQAKALMASAILEVQQDLEYKHSKESILKHMLNECRAEVQTRAESAQQQHYMGRSGSKASITPDQRTALAFQRICKDLKVNPVNPLTLSGEGVPRDDLDVSQRDINAQTSMF